MAIESSFNPFAQSSVGAQGPDAVMTRRSIPTSTSTSAASLPPSTRTNLRVGVKVLQECITAPARSKAACARYVGAANLASDGGYADKGAGEHASACTRWPGKPAARDRARAPPGGRPPASPSDDGTLVKVATLS